MLKDKICLVTGASRGIGKAIALEFANQGAIVVGTATSESGADKINQYLKDISPDSYGAVLNVTDSESVTTLLAQMTTQVGAPQVLVNNAGITRDNLMLRMKEEEWDAIMETNLKSLFRVSKACLRPMTKAKFGRIINIGSVVGSTGNAGQANYATAKAGLLGFTKSLAQEIGSRNITVNAIAPGFIKTDMTDALSDEQKQKLMTNIPLGALGTPENIAHATAFLASDMANYITGHTLHVNGGMYMN